MRWANHRRECVDTYLNLIGNDGTRAELCADLVGSDRIEIDKAEGGDEAICLQVLQISQGSHITLVRVVLPIELHTKQNVNGLRGPEEDPKEENDATDLQEVEMAGAHACHALADSGLYCGARKFLGELKDAPFSAAKNSVRWKVLLKLPLSE